MKKTTDETVHFSRTPQAKKGAKKKKRGKIDTSTIGGGKKNKGVTSAQLEQSRGSSSREEECEEV